MGNLGRNLLRPKIRLAYEKRYAMSYNLQAILSFAPGTTNFIIQPADAKYVYKVYEFHYGHLTPGAAAGTFYLTWWTLHERGIERFPDYAIPSTMALAYPMWLTITQEDPLYASAVNNTSQTQTIDWMAFNAIFKTHGYYDDWMKEVEKIRGKHDE